MDDGRVTIGSGDIEVHVDRVAGGRVAQILVGAVPLLIGPDAAPSSPIAWGAYPMVPWAGRIRHGRFTFDGTTHQLPLNHDGHAMHGVGHTMPWDATASDAASIALAVDLPSDHRWPFGGSVTQRIEADADGVSFEMTVSASDRAFPVSFGWHPWFRKPETLDFRPVAMYRRDHDHIAVDELVEVPAGPWDDCFVNHEPVTMSIDGIRVTMSSACTHWVVFDERSDATCVEPQTGPPDALNIAPSIIQPFGSATASFRLDAVDRDVAGSH